MKTWLSRLSSDYGMIVVLVSLCAFFSAVTYREQSLSGATAGMQLAKTIKAQLQQSVKALIVVRDLTEDSAFAEQLQRDLENSEIAIVNVVRGEPKDARDALQRLSATGTSIDVIFCTQATRAWRVLEKAHADFPAIGQPTIISPQTYHWPSFLKSDNLLNVANQIAVIAIVAIGMTMVIVSGGIDLSIGSLIALSAVITARCIRDVAGGMDATPLGMTLSCLVAIGTCGLVGAFSGAMITRFDVPPFIVTLAMMLVGSGLAYLTSRGQSVYEIPDSFVWLGREANLFGLPNAVVLMLILYALAHIMMSRMKLGRYLYAVGGNREAARLSGVPVERVLMFAYIASAVLAALGGVIMASQLKSGSPTYGNMYELYVIAAVVVGGASLSGGEGKMIGTLTGAFTIAVIQNGMNLTNIESYTQKVVLGLVILGAVLVDRIRHA